MLEMNVDGDGQIVEGVLSKDMTALGEYLHTWRLSSDIRNFSQNIRSGNTDAYHLRVYIRNVPAL